MRWSLSSGVCVVRAAGTAYRRSFAPSILARDGRVCRKVRISGAGIGPSGIHSHGQREDHRHRAAPSSVQRSAQASGDTSAALEGQMAFGHKRGINKRVVAKNRRAAEYAAAQAEEVRARAAALADSQVLRAHAESLKGHAVALLDRATPIASSAIERARPVVASARENAGPIAAGLIDRARPVAHDLADRARPVAEAVRERAMPLADELRERARPVAHELADRARPAASAVADRTVSGAAALKSSDAVANRVSAVSSAAASLSSRGRAAINKAGTSRKAGKHLERSRGRKNNRRWPLLAAGFAAGAGIGAVFGFLGRRLVAPEPTTVEPTPIRPDTVSGSERPTDGAGDQPDSSRP